jgi:mannose-6-phosphate isomerase-like protein (cupin superfamily)
MTSDSGLPIAPGTRLLNAFNKETFIFHDLREGLPSTEFQVLLDAGGSGGGNAVAHIHPESHEHFTVHTGVLKVMIDGVPAIARAGETVTVPRGATHYFANAHDGPTEVTIRFTPAQSQLRFFICFATIAATRPDWFDAQGVPHKLLMALMLHTYRGHFYLAGPPIWLQKVMFAALAPIARLKGYRLPLMAATVSRMVLNVASPDLKLSELRSSG